MRKPVQNDLAKAKERLERFAKRKQLSNKELELQTSLNERAALLERVLNDEGVGLKWRIGDLESRIKGATHDIYYAGAEYLVPESSDSAPGKFIKRTLPKDLRFSPALEQEFILASLLTNAAFWAVLGLVAAWFHGRKQQV